MPIVTMPDGAEVMMPDKLTPELAARLKNMQVSNALKSGSGAQNLLATIPEGVANNVSAMIAKPVSDVAGLAGVVGDATGLWKNNPAKTKASVQDSLTYSPRTEGGKLVAEYNPIALVGKGVGAVSDMAGDIVGGDASADTLQGIAGNFTREALPAALGFVGIRGKHSVGRAASSELAAGRTLKKALGVTRKSELPAIISQLENAPPSATTAQVLSGRGNNLLSGLEAVVGKTEMQQPLHNKLNAQIAKESEALDTLAASKNTAESIAHQQYLKKALENKLSPVRNEQLNLAGEANTTLAEVLPAIDAATATKVNALRQQGQLATEAAQQQNMARGGSMHPDYLEMLAKQKKGEPLNSAVQITQLGEGNFPNSPRLAPPSSFPSGAYPNPNMPRVPAQYTPNRAVAPAYEQAAVEMGNVAKQTQSTLDQLRGKVDDLSARGLTELSNKPLLDEINKQLSDPVVRVNTDKVAVLRALKDKTLAAGNNPRALAEVRRLGINQLVGDLISSGKVGKNAAGAALNELKPVIDDMITKAGGTKWNTDYMKPYAEGLTKVDELKALDELRNSYQQNPTKFAEMVGGKHVKWLEDIMNGETQISKALPSQLAKLNEITQQIKIRNAVSEQSKSGMAGATDLLSNQRSSFKLPNILSRKVTISNEGLKHLEAHVNKKMMKHIAKAMTDPLEAAKLLKSKTYKSAIPGSLATQLTVNALRNKEQQDATQ